MHDIIALDHQYLLDPEIIDVLSIADDMDIRMLQYQAQLTLPCKGESGIGMCIPRAGINNLPFKNLLPKYIDAVMPKYQENFNLSWNDITDLQALKFQELMLTSGKNLVLLWSGGIDSTCLVTAVLKNFEKYNLSRVSVACNWMSIIEYPKFYLDHICKHFQTIDSNVFNAQMASTTDVIAIHGNVCDNLTHGMAPYYEYIMSVRDVKLLDRSWEKDPDSLIYYMGKISQSNEYARWYYDKISENIKSVDIPLETYFDFIWWASFNYNWSHQILLPCIHKTDYLTWDQFCNRYVAWYNSIDYQLWSMKNNGAMVKHKGKFGSQKHHAKEYIFEYTQDKFYRDNKIKIGSIGQTKKLLKDRAFAVNDSLEIMYLDNDTKTILELLPSFLK
jgi:hypothetical protein